MREVGEGGDGFNVTRVCKREMGEIDEEGMARRERSNLG